MWLSLIQLALQAISGIAGYLREKKLLDAGQATAIAEGLKQTLENVEKANAAKNEVSGNPDGEYARRLRDKYEDDDH